MLQLRLLPIVSSSSSSSSLELAVAVSVAETTCVQRRETRCCIHCLPVQEPQQDLNRNNHSHHHHRYGNKRCRCGGGCDSYNCNNNKNDSNDARIILPEPTTTTTIFTTTLAAVITVQLLSVSIKRRMRRMTNIRWFPLRCRNRRRRHGCLSSPLLLVYVAILCLIPSPLQNYNNFNINTNSVVVVMTATATVTTFTTLPKRRCFIQRYATNRNQQQQSVLQFVLPRGGGSERIIRNDIDDDDDNETNDDDTDDIDTNDDDDIVNVDDGILHDEETLVLDNNAQNINISSILPTMKESTTATVDNTNKNVHLTVPQERPNSIYRFLLRQGYYGHVLVVIMAFITEWLTVYVPPIVHLLNWLIQTLVPRLNDNDFDDEYDAIYRRSSSRRHKKLSRKERQLQTKYDDEMAYQQLRRLDKTAAKYRYVSDDFLQRHRIGPQYSTTKLTSLQDVTKEIGKKSKRDKQRLKSDSTSNDSNRGIKDDDGDDNIDWVVEALTVAKNGGKSSMGLEIDLSPLQMKQMDRRRTVIAKAITADSLRRSRNGNSSSNHVSKNRNNQPGGSTTDALFGTLRAVTGTDSTVLSRTILGAYPGDAVPISEAANPNGVLELAQKYGYGDWPYDDDDDDEQFENDNVEKLPKKKTKKQEREKKPKVDTKRVSFMNQIELNSSPNFSFSVSLSNSDHNRTNKRRSPSIARNRLQQRANTYNYDTATTDSSTTTSLKGRTTIITNSDLPKLSPILQRRQDKDQTWLTKTTVPQIKIRSATELLSEKREQLILSKNRLQKQNGGDNNKDRM